MKKYLKNVYIIYLFGLFLIISCSDKEINKIKKDISEKAEDFKNNFDLAFEDDWSTKKAIRIIEKAVVNYKGFSCNNFEEGCKHEVFLTSDLRMDDKEYKIVLVVSFNGEADEPNYKWDNISWFQFLKTDFGWLLDKSYLGFTTTGTFGLNKESYNIFNIGLNKYALFHTGSYIGQGWLEDYIHIHTIVNGKMVEVLKLNIGSNGSGAGEDGTDWQSKVEIIKEGSGFYDIKVVKKGMEDWKNVNGEYLYKFNGTKYVLF